MKYLIGSCQEVALLMAQNEEGKLSIKNKLKLRLHTIMCAFCGKFEKQISLITEEIRYSRSEENLSAAAKTKIEKVFPRPFSGGN
ncbi:hypothetical protein BH20BAC1_BH20BAC1_19140 [soil metagenome]